MAACPTVTSAPMTVFSRPALTWTMVPSWMLERGPTRMVLVSPRSTQPYQTLAPSPISTSPITAAVGATKAEEWTTGSLPSKG
jgi:hypothetical protein